MKPPVPKTTWSRAVRALHLQDRQDRTLALPGTYDPVFANQILERRVHPVRVLRGLLARSVVTHDVPPMRVVAASHARPIRRRGEVIHGR